MDASTLYVSTDGGCTRNGKPDCIAVYGFVIIHTDDMESCELIRRQIVGKSTRARNKILNDSEMDCHELSGIVPTGDDLPYATNIRGELYAIKAALQHIDEWSLHGDIVWISDSEYSQKAIDIWSRDWEKDPKKLATKSNLDLVLSIRDTIDELRTERTVTMVHIHSHKPMPDINDDKWFTWFMNDRADKLCAAELATVI